MKQFILVKATPVLQICLQLGVVFGLCISQVAPVYAPGSRADTANTTPEPTSGAKVKTALAQSPNPAAETPIYNDVQNTRSEVAADTFMDEQGVSHPNREYKAFASTNDPYVDQPWEQQISLPAARQVGVGGYAPKVAIIDSGIAYNHQDLAASSWLTNQGESGDAEAEAASRLNCTDQQLPLDKSCNNIDDDYDGVVDNESGATSIENQSQLNCTDQQLPLDKSCNNIDDDQNGYIDDFKGFDFTSYDRSVLPGETDASGDGVTHGTLVTGVVGARVNNGVGLAGITSNVRLLPLQALDDSGRGYTVTVTDAIYYAISRQVDIINLSLGGPLPDAYLRDALLAANRAGITVFAASGNDGCMCAQYPAAYESVVSVGALDSDGERATFSNGGNELDIVAPGEHLYTTSWSVANRTTRYAYASGTSLSTPVVTGLAALLKSHNQSASPLQLKALLYEHASRLDIESGEQRNQLVGRGRVHAQASVARATTPLNEEQVYSFAQIRSGHKDYALLWTATEQDKSVIFYACVGSARPSATVYKLVQDASILYSASESDVAAAVENGYEKSKAFSWCTYQDHDTVAMIRSMNIYAELHNVYKKD